MGDFLFGKKPARKYKTRGWALVVGLRWVARINRNFRFFLKIEMFLV